MNFSAISEHLVSNY